MAVYVENKHFGVLWRTLAGCAPLKHESSRVQLPTKQDFICIKPLPNCQTSSTTPQLYSNLTEKPSQHTQLRLSPRRPKTKPPIKPDLPDTVIQISQIDTFISSRPRCGRSALSAPKWLARGPIVMSKSHRLLRQNLGTQLYTITIQPLPLA